MKTFKKILLGLLLLVATVGNAQWTGIGNNTLINQVVSLPIGPWVTNSDIVSGLTDVGGNSAPTAFYISTDLYLISGENQGTFTGKKWSGSTWVTDSGIISGLTDVGLNSAPTTFYISTDLYLISGESDGVFNGWKWSGSTWVTDSGIISGLTDVGINSTPTVFYIDTDLYLITGTEPFEGWKWSGSTWVSDSGIVSGLTDDNNDSPTAFYIGADLYLINGSSTVGFTSVFTGWKWNGSSWDTDSAIVSGLSTPAFNPAPTTLYIGANLYLIVGKSDGNFNGFKY